LYFYAVLVFDDVSVAAIVGVSMIISSIFAVLIATFVPLLLRSFGKDPAVGAGPFTTIVQDILALLVYFLVASLIL
ncbi:MAG TPA: magnesium transporter, partial [Candidatus Paceibacterota bacterium]